MEKLRFMRGAAALLAGSAMLFASCSDDDAPMPDPELTPKKWTNVKNIPFLTSPGYKNGIYKQNKQQGHSHCI